MNSKGRVGQIASKAHYIEDLALAILSKTTRTEIPAVYADDMIRKLQEVAETLEEYHDFGEEV